MTALRVVMDAKTEAELLRSHAVAATLREVARQVERKVRAPKRLTLSTRAGVGRRGSFAQVIMTGPGAVTAEFGTRAHPAKGPLRSALRGGGILR